MESQTKNGQNCLYIMLDNDTMISKVKKMHMYVDTNSMYMHTYLVYMYTIQNIHIVSKVFYKIHERVAEASMKHAVTLIDWSTNVT